ncbi:carbohydrate ABC transporter permease [Yinghuangia sp. YIM S09857]|uniref:carbohydrate ABC transporter permease n=1 Tax=Yinghuangia sp. YIM S09857 TaxID=3436929 RepID=UPI003F53DABF
MTTGAEEVPAGIGTATAAEVGTGRKREAAPEPGGGIRRNLASRIVARTGGGAVAVGLVLIALFWLMPTFGLLMSSLRPSEETGTSGWWKVFSEPGQITWSNYDKLLSNDDMMRAFFNTIWITVPSTLLVIIIGALAAYAFAWLEFPGRDWLFLVVVGLLVVPVQVALIPISKLYGETNLFGTILGVVLFHVAFGLPFAVFLLRNYFAGIPKDLLEAARMDGGTDLTIFFRVILPLGLPAIASLGIFQFLWVWNDMLIALIYADTDSAPLTVALQSQSRAFGANIEVLAPGAFLSLIVPLLVFFSFQRYFVQGVMAGAVK